MGRKEEFGCLGNDCCELAVAPPQQQAQWGCPVGKTKVRDETALSCANLNTGDRKKGGVLPPSGGVCKIREPQWSVQCQSWERNSYFQEVFVLY